MTITQAVTKLFLRLHVCIQVFTSACIKANTCVGYQNGICFNKENMKASAAWNPMQKKTEGWRDNYDNKKAQTIYY